MRMLVYGFIIGLIVPIIGIFVYLQVSRAAGDVLLMPLYFFSGIFNEPFWYLSFAEQTVLFIACGFFYSFILSLIGVSPNLNSEKFNQE